MKNIDIPFGIGLARNLYVAVQSAVADASWPMSQDGFPQQRSWSDRSGNLAPHLSCADFQAVVPFPLTPQSVAAGASSPL
jgi:hypothetical protein